MAYKELQGFYSASTQVATSEQTQKGNSMADRHPHALHQGELYIHRKMNNPIELVDTLPRYINPTMPQQHADFFIGLSYLPVATMDKDGRPWATLLVTSSDDDPSVGIRLSGQDELDISSLNGVFDPFVRALEGRKNLLPGDEVLFAGVGVDFSNRRRNKIAGTVLNFDMKSKELLHLALKSDQHLGNCPKYITVRSLESFPRVAEVALDQFDSFDVSLPEPCRNLIARSSTVFLATRHIPDSATSRPEERDMGLNHRGGAPGFVRVYEEIRQTVNKNAHDDMLPESPTTTYVVLPDHSGNRFYQSLGNVQSDRLVGLTFPDFTNGDMLYLTGIAENLFKEEAEELMPRVSVLTRIQITGAVYVKGALQLRMTSSEEYSPYNPPVRYLRQELENMHHVQESLTPAKKRIRADLISTQQLSESVRKFTFELSAPVVETLPGGFGIFDFSEHFDTQYQHMDESNPQSVNDDYIRTWTISSATHFLTEAKTFDPVQQIDITIKRKDGGAVSSFLHDHGNKKNSGSLSVNFVGNGGAFSCFSQETPDKLPVVPPHMLWIAGGVGITPFMSMWDGILSLDKALAKDNRELIADVVLVFAGRDDDLDLLKHFLTRNSTNSRHVRMSILGFQSLSENTDQGSATRDALVQDYPDASMVIELKRVDGSSLAGIEKLSERQAFMCGPDGFMRHTQTLLESLDGVDLDLQTESYSF